MRKTRLYALTVLVLLASMASLAANHLLYTAKMTADKENPPTKSTAWGVTFVVLDPEANTLSYRVSSMGFGDAPNAVISAHLHVGGPQTNGSVRYPLKVDATGNGSGIIQLTPPETATFVRTEFYANLHTQANTGGAIRGQLAMHPGADYLYDSSLSGANENPPTTSPAKGMALVYADTDSSPSKLAYWISSTGFGDAPAAVISSHIHSGGAKANGGVVVGLPVDATGNGGGALTLTAAQRSTLLRNELYVNLHTGQFTAGAIRGQAQIHPGPSLQYVFNRNAASGTWYASPEYGFSVVNAESLAKGQIFDLVDRALGEGPPAVQISPAFDPMQYPNGPMRARALLRPVKIKAGEQFMASPGIGVQAAGLPDGISREEFRTVYFQDYTVSVNEVDINSLAAAPQLFGPVVVGAAQLGGTPETPAHTITGYNLAFRIETPGDYLVGVRWKTGKTLKISDQYGGNVEAAEVNLVIPVTVTGSRPVGPFAESQERAAPAASGFGNRGRLEQAIRQALEEYLAGTTEAQKTLPWD